MTTAIIIRDPNAPKIHILEVDGPNPNVFPIVHYSPRINLPTMSFHEYLELPDHDKTPRYNNPSIQDFDSACRISRLISDLYNYSGLRRRRYLEIQSRLELLFPGCTGEILHTQPNLQSA